jgi:hypothetical protein
MKRVTLIISSAFVAMLATAGTALAQANYPPDDVLPTGGQAPTVGPAGGPAADGGVAFTGGDISFTAVAFAILLVVGVTALVVARRRAARLAG